MPFRINEGSLDILVVRRLVLLWGKNYNEDIECNLLHMLWNMYPILRQAERILYIKSDQTP